MGFWYVVQYYASSEEAPEYSCMKSVFGLNNNQVCHKEKYETHNEYALQYCPKGSDEFYIYIRKRPAERSPSRKLNVDYTEL